MVYQLALISPTGKLGSAVIASLLENSLLPASSITICTTSPLDSPKITSLVARGLNARRISFSDPASLRAGFEGCTALFLVSSPNAAADFTWLHGNEAAPGREAEHFDAIRAARDVGVKWVVYTSLAFGRVDPKLPPGDESLSKAMVMKAHLRTEAFLAGLDWEKGHGWTVLREGLYNESWPLYLGHYNLEKGKADDEELVVAGDGKISWTAISDLGLATAVILARGIGALNKGNDPDYLGKNITLSQKESLTMAEVADLVSKISGKPFKLKVVSSRKEHEEYHVKRGLLEDHVKWWSSSYDALKDGEGVQTDSTLDDILSDFGQKPTPMEATVKKMAGKE